jgi:predicted nuclease of predicted toxin-antitoxin system
MRAGWLPGWIIDGLLFDDCVPRQLRSHFALHSVTLAQEIGWKGVRNGSLLTLAQTDYDALITTDSNIYHQNVVAQYDIAVIVLRAYRTTLAALLETIDGALDALTTIRPGEVIYVYADDRLKESDRRKKKGPFDV